MNWYWIGVLFTAGFMAEFDDSREDSWKMALLHFVLWLAWPFYWGIQVGSWLKKYRKDAVKK